jgi:predicted amidohydrolase YtcJ
MPGLHDAHTHLEMAGLLLNHMCRLPDNAVPAGIVAALKSCESDLPEGWIRAGLYSPFVFENAQANKDFLDAAFPDTPVYLSEYSIHHGLANSKALELAGIDKDTPNPPGGVIVRDPKTGDATGVLVEAASLLVDSVIPEYDKSVYPKVIRWAAEQESRYGITSIQESSASLRVVEVLNALDADGELPLRVAAHLVWQEYMGGDGLVTIRAAKNQYTSPRVDTRFTKLWLDGAPLPPHFTQADLDEAGNIETDMLLIKQQELNAILADQDRKGITVKMHVAGEGAARAALDALEYTREVNGNSGIRHELAHAGFVSAEDIVRMKTLGTVAEMSPAMWHLKGPAFEGLKYGFKFRTMQENGIPMVVGSDWVITPAPNLFPPLEGMLDRGEESIDLPTALAALTINGVESIGQEENIGSIEAGKFATFIVLNQNLFEIPVEMVSETVVEMTVFEGKVVFQLQ